MRASVLYDEFRRRAFDTAEPYLWSETEVYSYLDQAQRDFVRLSGGIRDSRNPDCYITTAPEEPYVEISETIMKIVRARRVDTGALIDVIGASHPDALCTPHAGPVHSIVVGEDEHAVRCVNVPEEEVEIQLTVQRLPLKHLERSTDFVEVREEQAYWLLPGALALAYRKEDAETKDDAKADKYQAEFERLAATAFLENKRRHGAARSVAYGGI
jgi:hypothetical protein